MLDKKKRLDLALARVPGYPVPFDKHDYLIIFSFLDHRTKLLKIALLNKKHRVDLKNSFIARENQSFKLDLIYAEASWGLDKNRVISRLMSSPNPENLLKKLDYALSLVEELDFYHGVNYLFYGY